MSDLAGLPPKYWLIACAGHHAFICGLGTVGFSAGSDHDLWLRQVQMKSFGFVLLSGLAEFEQDGVRPGRGRAFGADRDPAKVICAALGSAGLSPPLRRRDSDLPGSRALPMITPPVSSPSTRCCWNSAAAAQHAFFVCKGLAGTEPMGQLACGRGHHPVRALVLFICP